MRKSLAFFSEDCVSSTPTLLNSVTVATGQAMNGTLESQHEYQDPAFNGKDDTDD